MFSVFEILTSSHSVNVIVHTILAVKLGPMGSQYPRPRDSGLPSKFKSGTQDPNKV